MLYLLLTLSTPLVSPIDVEIHQVELARTHAALADARRRVGLGFAFASVVGLGGWAAMIAAMVTATFGGEEHAGATTAFGILTAASFISCLVLFAMAGGGIARLRRAKRRLSRIQRDPHGFEL